METLKPLIDQLVNMIQQGTDLVNGQLPEVAKQIIAYNTWACHFWMWFGAAFAILGILLFILSVIGGEDFFFVAFIGFLATSLGVLVFGVNYSETKKMQLAPKVYLIEYLKSVLK